MKVLLINGSPKENGNTFTALSEVAKTLNEEGVETEIISIGKQAVQGCIACGMCGRNLNMPVVSSQYWNMVYGQTPGQATQDEEGMQTMRTLGRNMAWMIRKLNVSEDGHPELESPLRTNFIR